MTRWLLASSLLVAALEVDTVRAAYPERVVHRPPTVATIGQPLEVSVVLEGVGDEKPKVVLHCRYHGGRKYASLEMSPAEDGRYIGEIPERATRSLSVSYYIEVESPKQLWSFSLGSAQDPVRVDLIEPTAEKEKFGVAAKLAATAVPLLLVAGLLWLWERKQRLEVVDRMFWVKTLMPLAPLRGRELSEAVTRLVREPLEHPSLGYTRYRRDFVQRKLTEFRTSELRDATRPRDRERTAAKSPPREAYRPARASESGGRLSAVASSTSSAAKTSAATATQVARSGSKPLTGAAAARALASRLKAKSGDIGKADRWASYRARVEELRKNRALETDASLEPDAPDSAAHDEAVVSGPERGRDAKEEVGWKLLPKRPKPVERRRAEMTAPDYTGDERLQSLQEDGEHEEQGEQEKEESGATLQFPEMEREQEDEDEQEESGATLQFPEMEREQKDEDEQEESGATLQFPGEERAQEDDGDDDGVTLERSGEERLQDEDEEQEQQDEDVKQKGEDEEVTLESSDDDREQEDEDEEQEQEEQQEEEVTLEFSDEDHEQEDEEQEQKEQQEEEVTLEFSDDDRQPEEEDEKQDDDEDKEVTVEFSDENREREEDEDEDEDEDEEVTLEFSDDDRQRDEEHAEQEEEQATLGLAREEDRSDAAEPDDDEAAAEVAVVVEGESSPAVILDAKQSTRQGIWDELAAAKAARFPYPPHKKIPNFAGAEEAASRLFELPVMAKAQRVIATLDSPQRFFREEALTRGVTLFVPRPKLRAGFLRLDPANIPAAKFSEAVSAKRCHAWGERVPAQELPECDSLVVGAVVVARNGYHLGKGDGSADLLYALLRELGHQPAPVLTSVHSLQVVSELPHAPHDLPISGIATPTEIIEISDLPAGPSGVDWDALTPAELKTLPDLKVLRRG